MSEEFGSDFITLIDDNGEEFELEFLDEMTYNGKTYSAFLPTDLDENDPDYGLVLLRNAVTFTFTSKHPLECAKARPFPEATFTRGRECPKTQSRVLRVKEN